MSNLKQIYHNEIKAQFEALFKQMVAEEIACETWTQTDVVFRNGKASQEFGDVEFLMASDHNGNSLLYTSQSQGNSIYSVVGSGTRISFSSK